MLLSFIRHRQFRSRTIQNKAKENKRDKVGERATAYIEERDGLVLGASLAVTTSPHGAAWLQNWILAINCCDSPGVKLTKRLHAVPAQGRA
jgi:hypothetical protein